MNLLYPANVGTIAEEVEVDPALLAFVKCHVTSSLKWDALRLMAERADRWLGVSDVAGPLHRQPLEVGQALADLAREGVLEVDKPDGTTEPRYRLPAHEPTTVVLRRLLAESVRSLPLRSIIANYLLQRRADRRAPLLEVA